jgi:hypothetical protein
MWGWYRAEGGKVIMCDTNGRPVRDSHGTRYERTLEPGQNPHVIAAVLTREIRRKLTGSDGSRDLEYPPLGLA